jgi:hypothetical protein
LRLCRAGVAFLVVLAEAPFWGRVTRGGWRRFSVLRPVAGPKRKAGRVASPRRPCFAMSGLGSSGPLGDRTLPSAEESCATIRRFRLTLPVKEKGLANPPTRRPHEGPNGDREGDHLPTQDADLGFQAFLKGFFLNAGAKFIWIHMTVLRDHGDLPGRPLTNELIHHPRNIAWQIAEVSEVRSFYQLALNRAASA